MDTSYLKELCDKVYEPSFSTEELLALSDKLGAEEEDLERRRNRIVKAQDKARQKGYLVSRFREIVARKIRERGTLTRSISAKPAKVVDHVHCHPENPESLEALRFEITTCYYLQGIIQDETTIGTGIYYRFHGVLQVCGGGHNCLRVPSLCSDEEWEGMKQGKIPEKFFMK